MLFTAVFAFLAYNTGLGLQVLLGKKRGKKPKKWSRQTQMEENQAAVNSLRNQQIIP